MKQLSTLTDVQAADLAVRDGIRLLTCAASLDVGPIGAAKEFVRRWPNAPHVAWVEKAVTDPITIANTGQLLPPVMLDPLMKRLQQAAVINRIPGVTHAPLMVPVPIEKQPAAALQWVPEGGTKPTTTLLFDTIKLQNYKGAAILTLSVELAKGQPGAEDLIRGRLTAASTRFVDREFLDPTVAAVPGLNPASITNGAPTVTPTGDLGADLVALEALFFTNRPGANRPTFIASPRVVAAVSGSGSYPTVRVDGGFLHGIPVVVTPGAGSTLVLVDAEGLVVHDGGVQLDVSRDATLQSNTTPDNPPTAVTTTVPLWPLNLIGIRIDRFVSWQAEPTAVAYLVIA